MQAEPPTMPLPATIQRALAAIAKELADMPRECARDHQELCLWKGRLARRLRGVATMRVPVEPIVVGVVAKNDTPKSSRHKSPASRIIRTRNGRLVRVEIRQLEMQL